MGPVETVTTSWGSDALCDCADRHGRLPVNVHLPGALLTRCGTRLQVLYGVWVYYMTAMAIDMGIAWRRITYVASVPYWSAFNHDYWSYSLGIRHVL